MNDNGEEKWDRYHKAEAESDEIRVLRREKEKEEREGDFDNSKCTN